jgi:DNA end-binding protein Ku
MARALWKGAISFGLVTIPVSLYPVKNVRENVTFHMLHASDLRRVHSRWVDEENHEIPFEDIVKGYEYEKDHYVIVSEADLKAANVEATQSIDIMHFVDTAEIDIAYYDTPYYTEPTKVGRRAYVLLRETLKRTGKVGVARVVIRERQHLCAVLPDGPALVAYTLRWPYQLRDASDLELPDMQVDDLGLSPQELKMAEQLVEMMAAPWEPEEYRDTYHEDLLRLIDQKVKAGDAVAAPEPLKPEAKQAEVVDIMELLRRSVEARGGAAPGGAAPGSAARGGAAQEGVIPGGVAPKPKTRRGAGASG